MFLVPVVLILLLTLFSVRHSFIFSVPLSIGGEGIPHPQFWELRGFCSRCHIDLICFLGSNCGAVPSLSVYEDTGGEQTVAIFQFQEFPSVDCAIVLYMKSQLLYLTSCELTHHISSHSGFLMSIDLAGVSLLFCSSR